MNGLMIALIRCSVALKFNRREMMLKLIGFVIVDWWVINMVLHIEFNWCRCTGVLIGLSFSLLTARWKINGTADWVLTIRYRFIRITQGYVTVRVRHSSSISISISSNSSSSISGHRALCIRMSISIRTSNQCPTSIRGSIRRSG